VRLYRALLDQRRRDALGLTPPIDGEHGDSPHSLTPVDWVRDYIQAHRNHFPELDSLGEAMAAELGAVGHGFEAAAAKRLEAKSGVQVRIATVQVMTGWVRRYDPHRRRLMLAETLDAPSRAFSLAYQLAVSEHTDAIDSLTEAAAAPDLPTRQLLKVSLTNYLAGAILMPYRPFYEAARAERYDVELLAHRFGASFEQVCHRLTTLKRPGAEGVPFHFLRIDIAGNISKRFSASGIRIARFSGACPRWNIHAALLTPGMIRVQLSKMPDGAMYFCIARTVTSDRGGYHVPHTVHAIGMGCEVQYARELVYADGVDLDNAAVPVGVTCRMCERLDCEQRAFPAIQHPLRITENVRGVSFFAPVEPR
jgi:predicted transcriptional regulator